VEREVKRAQKNSSPRLLKPPTKISNREDKKPAQF